MTGQIPPYGQYFRWEPCEYSPLLAGRRYILRADERYHIRSDKTSERWFLFFEGHAFAQRGTMTAAMQLMRSLTAVPMTEGIWGYGAQKITPMALVEG